MAAARRAALTAAALVGLGCGGGSAAPPAAAPQTCAELGIDAAGGREGTCVHGGVERTVVDRGRSLELPGDLTVRLAGLRRPQSGEVVAELRVTNLADAPLRWARHARARVSLYVGDELHEQSAGGRHPTIAPGGTATVVARWRVPRTVARRVRARGSALVVLPQREIDAGARSVAGALRIGLLRLWK